MSGQQLPSGSSQRVWLVCLYKLYNLIVVRIQSSRPIPNGSSGRAHSSVIPELSFSNAAYRNVFQIILMVVGVLRLIAMRQTASARSHRSQATSGSATGHAVGFAMVVTAVMAVATAPVVAVGAGVAAAVAVDVGRTVSRTTDSNSGPPTTNAGGQSGGAHPTAD
jgi:hypothetical protein